MKNIRLLLVALFFSPMAQAQPLLTKDQQDVQKAIVQFFESLSNRDSLEVKKYCTEDITLIEYARVWNLDTLILKSIRQNTASDFIRTNTHNFITTTVDKNTAWSTYNLHSVITKEGKQTTIDWIETVVVVKERNKWKIKVLHSSLIKRN